MCMSPHEMTSKQIELVIATYDKALNSGNDRFKKPLTEDAAKILTGRRERFLQVLKERAENGTYNIDPVPDGSW